MALTHFGPIEMQTSPDSASVGLDPSIHYDFYADELILKLDQHRRQSFSLPVNDVVSLLYDDEANETIGIQIDNFASYAVHHFPALSIIAKIVGIVPRDPEDTPLFREDRIVRMRSDFTKEDETRFKEVIRRIIDFTGGFDPEITVVQEGR